jgi:Na+/melibiose symporter-like transporter
VPIGVVLLVLAIAYIPATTERSRSRLDVVGVLQMGAGLLAVMLAVSYLGSANSSPASPLFVCPLLAGLGAFTLFVRHSGRTENPFVSLRLLRGKGFAAMNVMNFLFGTAVFGFSALVPLYAQERYGMHSLASGSLLTARAVGMIAVAAAAALALRRTGYRLPMIVGFLVSAAGTVMLAVAPVGLTPYVWLSVSAAVTGIGMGLCVPASNNAMLHLEPQSTAAISGLRGMFRQAGGISGLAVVTAVLARSSDPGMAQAYVFLALAGVLVCLTPMVFRVPEHHGSW